MHWIRYSVGEAWDSLWRQKVSVLLSILTISAALLVLGGFLLAGVNLDRALARWSAAAEFSIYLRDDISPEQRVVLNRLVAESPLVVARQYVSREDALHRFRRDFPDLAAGVTSLPQNPLPASIELRLNPQRSEGAAIEALARHVQASPGVSDVRFDRRWLERLGRIASGVRWIGWVLGGVLLAAAALTVATVVRLALHARRDEVEIMQLMGAPLGLLRGPLVVEGIFHGGLGATLALGVLFAAYVGIQRHYGAEFAALLGPSSAVGFLPPALSILLLTGGMLIGGVGGLLAARHVR